MTHYRRNFLPGATYFFTVNLAERRSPILTDNIDLLRGAFRDVRRRHPFGIDAIAILPNHLHAVWTLPEGDANFPVRWRLIKAEFPRPASGRTGLGQPVTKRRARCLAAPLLGANNPRRSGFCAARRLH
jgi:REP-associated tyrosine transposase